MSPHKVTRCVISHVILFGLGLIELSLGLEGTCDGGLIFCRAQDYKPLGVFDVQTTVDENQCVNNCKNNSTCSMAGYLSEDQRCLLSTVPPTQTSVLWKPGGVIYWRKAENEQCSTSLHKDPSLPVLVQGFDARTPYLELQGSVRLPAIGGGKVGSGACVDKAGAGNCITLEPNAVGCSYEPDECTEGFTWSFWFKLDREETTPNIPRPLLRTGQRPGYEVNYVWNADPNSINFRIVLNVRKRVGAWFEHCYFKDNGFPNITEWTHVVTSWKNVIPASNQEESDGLKAFINGQLTVCNNGGQYYPNKVSSGNTVMTVGCNENNESYFAACYDEIVAYERPLTDAEVMTLYNSY